MFRLVLITTLGLGLPSLADGIPNAQPLVYSGVLQNSLGVAVTTTTGIGLSLFDDPSANAATNRKCDTPIQPVTPDDQGRFRIVLDPTCLAAVRANPNLWVQLLVAGVLLPRAKLGAVPYAVEADRATTATSASTASAATGALASTLTAKADRSGSAIVTPWVLFPGSVESNAPGRPYTLEAARWRRVGNSLEFAYRIAVTGTWPGSQMIFVFPAVGVADFSIAPNGSVAGTVWHQYNNLSWISSFCALGGAATNCLVDSNWPGISRRWQAGDTVHMTATVPISGWSATGI